VTHGLIIGKFLPPHAGHLHLIRTARNQVDALTVIVFSLAAEPIPGEQRRAWLQAACPGVRVLHRDDENPQEPHEHPDFWDIWTSSIRRACPEPVDVVFTSEHYGDELARRLEARHVCVDRERLAYPVSGTAVRRDPWANAHYLADDVRAWFLRRVVVTGPESTGKTTLARDLAAAFDTTWVPEYARAYLDAKYPGRPDGQPLCVLDDMPEIARGQVAAEDAKAREARRVLFCDTDAAVTAVYSREYFGVVATTSISSSTSTCRGSPTRNATCRTAAARCTRRSATTWRVAAAPSSRSAARGR
jgi:HTH-type transcriptional regulator, transcriptional repressor of NAD biosynthesis genes